MRNTHKRKKILPATFSFLIILALLLFLVQFSPVNAQEETATLTGVLYDEGVDTDDDGYFDYLSLGIEVNVTVSENYTVSVAGVYNETYVVAGIAVENSTYLDTGVHVVYLEMNGTSIYDSGIDPYGVTGVNLYDENGTQLDATSELLLSQDYSYTDFQHEGKEGWASLTGEVYDEGVDTDDDGYFDYLSLGIEVNVTVPATYVVTVAGINNRTYTFSSIFAENSTYLDVGVHVVYLDMNGTSIYVSGLDPYSLKGVSIFDDNGTQIHDANELLLSQSYYYTDFQPAIIELVFREVEREIFLDQAGSIYVTTAYRIINLAFQVSDVEIGLPEGVYGVVVRDEMGELEATAEDNILTVTFREILNTSEMETIYLGYRVPWENCVSQQNGIDYSLNFTFCEGVNSTIGELTVSVILPEGAQFQSSTPRDPDGIKEDGQVTLTFDVDPLGDLTFTVDYKHLLFWDSFYPTVWIGIIVVVVLVLSFFWKAPKLAVSQMITVPPKDLASFVDSYEEKARIRSELESLEERLRKGKIPRRRYKVRRRMLEGRLSALSRNLSSLTDTIRSAGSQYAGMMRQIEVAEANLEGAVRELKRVESRYRRGEVSKGAYGKLVNEYKSRIEEAEATIDGVLLRLRE